MGKPILEVKNLSVEFITEEETTLAVNNISFSLNKGETIGIVGESGSGKSVTSLSIMNLVQSPPGFISNGEIIYTSPEHGEVDLLQLDKNEIRKFRGNEISMIFQEPMTSLNPVFTCGQQVAEAIMLHQNIAKDRAKAKTIKLFEEVKLPRPEAIYNSYPHQISGGQKQRVMIAMAMSCEPSILIADEPTTALDVTVQKTILDLMQDIEFKYNKSIIFITHDLGVIAELADKIIVMYKGCIVEQGNVWKIFSDPQHPYTKSLLSCRPSLRNNLSRLPTISNFMQFDEKGNMVEIKKSVKDTKRAFRVNEDEREERLKKMYEQEPVMRVENVSTYFKGPKNLFKKAPTIKAVDDVSFEIYPGETLGLVGESGCGKTTLGRTLLKLIELTHGKIIYRGQDINKISKTELRHLRKKIQIIFQDPYSSLNPRALIGDAILEPMKVHNIGKDDEERKAKVFELLKKVNLKESHYYRYPHEFSGGQRQRICIARALALKPEFIICDESVSALDVSVQAQVLNLLNDLQEEFNFTYIFISHDLSVVKFMSDRIIVMNQGKIEEIGDSREIYANPKSEYTKKLIQAIPKGELADIKAAAVWKEVRRQNQVHLEKP
ncbi:MAG: ABC transporter ATP-binding protein [Flavobacteriales bacterium]|nr:ABC transporter ATP-binding protein [Flavobacteriales bacterium]